MASYYLDCEFNEGMRKPIWWLPTIGRFNKPKWGIELISIGIKCEDGRTYYAISDEFNAATCNDWVVKNVLTKLPRKYLYEFPYDNPHAVVPDYGVGIGYKNPVYKSLKQIMNDVTIFCSPINGIADDRPEFYAYFADYDWVVFCSLFEAMINLPKGFPMYCKGLKQSIDELAEDVYGYGIGTHTNNNRVTFESVPDALHYLKMHSDYPKQADEHNALSDAIFNEHLHNFINSFKK